MKTPPILTDKDHDAALAFLNEYIENFDGHPGGLLDVAASIRALREERDRCARNAAWILEESGKAEKRIADERDAAIAAKDEAVRDAERYQWLRDQGPGDRYNAPMTCIGGFPQEPILIPLRAGEKTDAAIDAAIKRKKQ